MTSSKDELPGRRHGGDVADLTAMLGAFCFFLSTIEYLIPKPLPFLRLGIANLPLLIAVDILPLPWFMVLAIVKVIGMSLFSGSLFSFVALFSFAGTMAAALVMRASRRLGGPAISTIGISVLGAAASNSTQVVLAIVLVFGDAARLIAPVFLGMGLVTGVALGVFAEGFHRSSAWLTIAMGRIPPEPASDDAGSGTKPGGAPSLAGTGWRKVGTGLRAERRASRRARYESLFDPTILAAGGMAISIAFLLQRNVEIRAAMCLVFLVVTIASGRGFSPLATLFVMAGIVAANLLVPMGKVLATIGPFPVTTAALEGGLGKALAFEGLIFLSRASILPTLRLPGHLGSVIAKAFVYYGRILEQAGELRPSSVLRDADALMLGVWREPAVPEYEHAGRYAAGPEIRGSGVALVAAAVAVSFALLLA